MNEGKLGHLERASVLAASDDPKDQDKAREIKTRFDYESLKRQIGSKKKPSKPAVKEAVGAGVPLTPQELEIQKKMSRLNVRLAKKRSQQLQKAKLKDAEDSPEQVKEGSLHKWFKGSKSKDGKPGWVNVKTGGTCASDEPGEGTPKCVSSAKRASMTKAERESASRRKKAADPNQQQKSGAAKPTYVRTDAKKKMKEDWKPEIEHSKLGDAKKKADKKRESKLPPHLQGDAIGKMKKAFASTNEEVVAEADKKGKGSGTKDACYHKVKASAKVWPSAYASGRLVQCRKKGAANYGKSKSEEFENWTTDPILEKVAAWQRKEGKSKSGGLNEKGRKSYEKENPGSDLKAPQPEGGSRKKSFCARMGGMKKKLTSAKTANDPDSRINKALRKWNCSYEPEGTPIMEEDKAFNTVVAALRKKHGKDAVITKDSPKPKPPSEAQKKKAAAERKKRQDADNKAYAARAKKAGFKSTQDYTNVVARYGSEDNYRKGKGLGT